MKILTYFTALIFLAPIFHLRTESFEQSSNLIRNYIMNKLAEKAIYRDIDKKRSNTAETDIKNAVNFLKTDLKKLESTEFDNPEEKKQERDFVEGIIQEFEWAS